MWKSIVGWLLIIVSFFLVYEAWTYWGQLTTWASFIIGAASGGCLAAGLLLILWRPSHPAPAPWERNRWH